MCDTEKQRNTQIVSANYKLSKIEKQDRRNFEITFETE